MQTPRPQQSHGNAAGTKDKGHAARQAAIEAAAK